MGWLRRARAFSQATYVASFHSVSAGAPLAIAIAIHNIPEGLAVAMPVRRRRPAFSHLYCSNSCSRLLGGAP